MNLKSFDELNESRNKVTTFNFGQLWYVHHFFFLRIGIQWFFRIVELCFCIYLRSLQLLKHNNCSIEFYVSRLSHFPNLDHVIKLSGPQVCVRIPRTCIFVKKFVGNPPFIRKYDKNKKKTKKNCWPQHHMFTVAALLIRDNKILSSAKL